MSRVAQRTASWDGFSKINRIVIFGASYCSVLTGMPQISKVKPTASNPLSGQAFPGSRVWNEEGKPNWVGHIITKYRTGPLFKPGEPNAEWERNPLLVYDYAVGGSTIAEVGLQVAYFLDGMKGNGALSWKPEETLFISWIGINDCAKSLVHENDLKKLFELQGDLYSAGARNFLFIDVPSMWRIPGIKGDGTSTKLSVGDWNTNLVQQLEGFTSGRAEATTMLWSSMEAMDKLLDHPEEYGLSETDLKKKGGSIWEDHIHPTSAVHDHIARQLAVFLESV